VLCPLECFAKLCNEHTQFWEKRVRGDEGACSRFWESLVSHPIVAKHPVLKPADFPRTIALGLHADGAPLTKHESLFTIAWNSLHGTGTTMQTRFIFTCIKKSDMGPGTMEAIWDYFAWSMNSLLTGMTPGRDWLGRQLLGGGKPLAKGWRAACVQVRGDWEFYTSALNLPRWDGAENCCWVCAASITRPGYFWTDCSDASPWRTTIRTHESWLAEMSAAGKQVANLFKISGLRLEGVMIDTLHAIDQGIAVHAIANIFVEVMALNPWGSNKKTMLQASSET
jgi:hypothetical protein